MSFTLVPVLLAGGEGKRLWPLCSSDRPKQFLKLNSTEHTLFQLTVKRAQQLAPSEQIITVTSQTYGGHVCKQLDALEYILKDNVILEPCNRNTAAAIAMAANHAKSLYQNPVLLILPSDHCIDDNDGLKDAIDRAMPLAQEGKTVAFGVKPTRKDGHYDHFLTGLETADGSGLYQVSTFSGKPEGDMLRWLMQQENCYWNSGMYLVRADILLAEVAHREELTSKLANISYIKSRSTDHGVELDPLLYEAMPKLAIDQVILQDNSRLTLCPIDIGWSDINSWYSLWEISQKEGNGESLDRFLTKIAKI
jgi:mannose-1-phosphate guanylyltransferase/mannose-6-phosphate isomerase